MPKTKDNKAMTHNLTQDNPKHKNLANSKEYMLNFMRVDKFRS